MSNGGRNIFREKSLERLSSPERLDQLLRVIDSRSWLPLATLALLVGIVIVWACFGTVPVNVHGRGILVNPRRIAEIHAPGAGYVAELDIKVGDTVVAKQQIGRIDRPDLQKRLELQQQKAADLARAGRDIVLRQRDRFGGDVSGLDDASIDNYIAAARLLAQELRDKELQELDQEQQRLRRQREVLDGLHRSLKKRWGDQRSLFEQRVVSAEEVDRAESSYMDVLADLTRLDSELGDLRMRRLQAEEAYLDRLQDIADREQQLADVEREIERIRTDQARETRIVCEQGGKIVELGALPGQYVHAGARLGAVAVQGAPEELRSVTYFSVRDGKRLEAGKPIQITPDTVERERYGSIRGTIDSISPYPVSLEEAVSVIGNRGLAEALIADGYRIQVFARLESADTPSGFGWTSGSGPDEEFSVGTTTSSRAPVDERRPITFVFPFLRSATGVD